MRLRRGVARAAWVALAGAVLMTVTGNGYTSAGDVATPSTEPVPYTRSVRMAYTVRPDYLLDYEATVEYQIGTRAAAEDLAQQRVGVNEHFDDLQIVEAATLKADGRRLDVPPGKIMKKSSSDHGAALFDADETIRIIIFPDVSPGDRIRYVVDLGDAGGPFTIEAELWYQPIGYRWAHNLGDRKAGEIERFIAYYDEMAPASAVIIARAATTAR